MASAHEESESFLIRKWAGFSCLGATGTWILPLMSWSNTALNTPSFPTPFQSSALENAQNRSLTEGHQLLSLNFKNLWNDVQATTRKKERKSVFTIIQYENLLSISSFYIVGSSWVQNRNAKVHINLLPYSTTLNLWGKKKRKKEIYRFCLARTLKNNI